MYEIVNWITIASFLLAILSFFAQSRDLLPQYHEYIKLFMVFAFGMAAGTAVATILQSRIELDISSFNLNFIAKMIVIISFLLGIGFLLLYAMFGSKEISESLQIIAISFLVGIILYGLTSISSKENFTFQETMLVVLSAEENKNFPRAIQLLEMLRSQYSSKKQKSDRDHEIINFINARIENNERLYLNSLRQ